MSDPYLYEGASILRNKLGITNEDELRDAEADYVSLRLRELAETPLAGDYGADHFLGIHRYIFQDIYDWAGKVRTINIFKEEPVLGGLSIDYADKDKIMAELDNALCDLRDHLSASETKDFSSIFAADLARLWKIHPFREGNTRTTVTFCCQLADSRGLHIDREIFEKNSAYVRTALVAYNANFPGVGDYSKKEYLEKIIADALN